MVSTLDQSNAVRYWATPIVCLAPLSLLLIAGCISAPFSSYDDLDYVLPKTPYGWMDTFLDDDDEEADLMKAQRAALELDVGGQRDSRRGSSGRPVVPVCGHDGATRGETSRRVRPRAIYVKS